jgi:hypothetical protein
MATRGLSVVAELAGKALARRMIQRRTKNLIYLSGSMEDYSLTFC